MKKAILFYALLLTVGTVAAQEPKIIDVAIDSISREAITITVTLSFAAVVRWFEKRRLRKKGKLND